MTGMILRMLFTEPFVSRCSPHDGDDPLSDEDALEFAECSPHDGDDPIICINVEIVSECSPHDGDDPITLAVLDL